MSSRLPPALRSKLPIQLAPMGSVSVTTALPLAVMRAGGHAVYPAVRVPPAALASVVEELARETAAFGVNFIVPAMDREALDFVAEHAPYVDFFLAPPSRELVEVVHRGGAVCGWQVETGAEARAAEEAGCDVVIAKAWESGGRKGVEGPTLLPLLDDVLNATALPVVAAGGIATERGVRAALAAGADAVRIGTRFIAAEESEAHPAWKQAVIAARASDSIVSMAFNVGMPEPGPHRVLRSSVEAAEALEDEQVGVVRIGGEDVEVPRFAALPPTHEATGNVEAMPFYAGQSAGAVNAVEPAADIMAELARGLA